MARARRQLPDLLALVAVTAVGCATASADGPGPDAPPAARECNGLAALCARPLDEVAFLRTHNSHASDERGYSHLAWNHWFAVPTQLEDGVRALNVDVYEADGEMVVCHGYCALGQQPLAEILAELTEFLAASPDEVVLLSLQNEAPWPRTLAALDDAGVAERALVHAPGTPWPTLADMLDAGTPLLVSAGGIPSDAPPWLHDDDDISWGDHWAAEVPADLDCAPENPPFEGGLYFYNNVLTAPLASPALAEQVNHDPDLSERLARCADENAHVPNIISVDFYSIGDTVQAVAAINAMER